MVNMLKQFVKRRPFLAIPLTMMTKILPGYRQYRKIVRRYGSTVSVLRTAWHGLRLDDIQLIELNEAFAAQSIGCIRELGLQDRMGIINVNGGAIALGHPIGSSGSRILVTLVHEMNKRGLRYGLATLCIAGGMGMATVVETVQ